MFDQRETTINQSLQPSSNDFENAIIQMDDYDDQIKSWQNEFKKKKNVYDEYVNKHELKVKELETATHDLQLSINRILSDFEGISNSERTSCLEAKKLRLLKYKQAIEREISIPINEFAAMEVTRENTASEDTTDKRAIKETLSLSFYQHLGITVHSNTKDNGHTMKLVSYHKPNVDIFTSSDGSDDFTNAQKIWDSISP